MAVPRRHPFALRSAGRAVRARTALGTPGLGVDPADAQFDSAHTYGLEAVESLFQHARWKIHETAELAGVDVFDYLVAVQRHASDAAERPGQRLPWNYRQSLASLSRGPPA